MIAQRTYTRGVGAPVQSPARRPRLGPTTRARILAAAADLFARDGFDATTVRAIGLGAGVTDAAIYYHFRSKAALLDALLVEPDVAPLLPSVGRFDAAAFTDYVITVFVCWSERPALVHLLMAQGVETSPLAGEFIHSLRDSYRRLLVPALAPWFAIPELIADALSLQVTGALLGALLAHPESFQQVIRRPAFRRRLRTLVDLTMTGAASLRAGESSASA
ncbi:MAG: TetR/AcrR family transcriptional regulator [Dehalococcoidia bacterium]|nr:TetR/AcrR family transcriptional regulator [Dehalococcoidia bacterium]